MILGKLAGAGAGWFIHPAYGTLIGAMLGHFVDLAWKKWRASKAETTQRRRERSRTIRRSSARRRGENLRARPAESLHESDSAFAARSPEVLSACMTLGVDPQDSRDKVKRRWRKLVNQYHPDKLHARGATAEEITDASDQLASVQDAWDCLREARRWR